MDTTYTLLAIDRINGNRVRKYKIKPQSGLTEKQLLNIKKRELKKLYDKHPNMSDKEKAEKLEVCLLYITDYPDL